MYTTIHNLFKTLHKLFTNTYKRLHSSTHLLQHFYKTIQNLTTLYTHLQQLYTILQHFLHNFTQTIQNSTQLYRTWASYRQIKKLYENFTTEHINIRQHLQTSRHTTLYKKCPTFYKKTHSNTTELDKHRTRIINSHIC